MVTYLELGSEQVWRDQIVAPNMTNLFVKPLREFYKMGADLIGAPGDNNHLRGRHRSRNWDLQSQYCTNRAYGTTDPRDKLGDGNWYRAVDIGITNKTLHDACHRMDSLVRSGRDGGRVAEWFGTFDGITVVGWFEGHAASSDNSHLTHMHVGIWTKNANDTDLMQLLYYTVTGIQVPQEEDDMQGLVRFSDAIDPNQVWLSDRMTRRKVQEWELYDNPTQLSGILAGTVPATGSISDISNLAGGALANGGKVYISSRADAWGLVYPPECNDGGQLVAHTHDVSGTASGTISGTTGAANPSG